VNTIPMPRTLAAPPEGGGFAGDWAAAVESATSLVPRHPTRDHAWSERLAEVAGRAVPGDVIARVRRDAERLGADDAALASADALARGEAVCVATGQQPGLFLGPLFTLHKAWTAVALARRLERRTGRRVVPLFWCAADDSDFAEVATAILPEPDGRLARFSLEGGELPAGGMVGDLATSGTARAIREAEPVLAGWPGWSTLVEHARAALERASDHGELAAAWLHALLPGTGLVVVDGRAAELRQAAVPLFVRYAARRGDVADALRAAGRRLEAAGYRAPLAETSTRQALFDARDGRRLPFAGSDEELGARASGEPETLSPNVVLRPLVQDSLFPNLATVAGPGELAYHAQLAPAYEQLDVGRPVLFPRFEATWVPEGVFDLAARRDVAPIRLVRDFDGALRDSASATIPAPLRDALESLERRVGEAAADARRAAGEFDPKLVDAAEELDRRLREACERLRDKAGQSARTAEARRDPSLRHYRELLRPRNLPQERVLSTLTVLLAGPPEGWEEAVRDHVTTAQAGHPAHWLLRMSLPREAAP